MLQLFFAARAVIGLTLLWSVMATSVVTSGSELSDTEIDQTRGLQLEKRKHNVWTPTQDRYHLFQSFPETKICSAEAQYNHTQLAEWTIGGFPTNSKKGLYASASLLSHRFRRTRLIFAATIERTEISEVNNDWLLYIGFAVQDKGHDLNFRGEIQIIDLLVVSIVSRTFLPDGQYREVWKCVSSGKSISTVWTDKNVFFNSW